MKLINRLGFPTLILISFSIIFSCQKKEGLVEEETPVPVVPPPTNNCPTCNLPDTAWTSNASGPLLIFKFSFDSMQTRLNNSGQVSTVQSGNGGQCPRFNKMAANYIELCANDNTATGAGVVLYKSSETTCGGAKAIVNCKSVVVKEGEVFFSIPLNQIPAGNYKWLRISLAYHNFEIKVRTTSAGMSDASITSFTGYNTYLSSYKMWGTVMTPTLGGTGNKTQGYWGYLSSVFGLQIKLEGQSPNTTVVNPNTTLPNPQGSSLVYGEFVNSNSVKQPLTVTGTESQNINITVSVSTNKSFEWKELTFDGLFQPEIGESVYDMGTRGIIPKY